MKSARKLARGLLVTVAAACGTEKAVAVPQIIAEYDAGAFGDPMPAPDPRSVGWNRLATGFPLTGPVTTSVPGERHAWEMTGAAQCSSLNLNYWRWIDQQFYFDYSIDAQITSSGGPGRAVIGLNTGTTHSDNGWGVSLDVSGNDIIARSNGWSSSSTFVCPGGAVGFHQFALRKRSNAGYFDAEFVYDGVVLGTMESYIPTFHDQEECHFGVLGCSSRMLVRRVVLAHGDGFAAAGPCAGLVPNSTGDVGTLWAYGSDVADGPGFHLVAGAMPSNTFGYFLLSFGVGSGPLPGSQGRLCLDAGTISRAWGPQGPLNSGSSGSFSVWLDPLNMPTNPPGPVGPGTLYFQTWYRDANPNPTSNTSGAISVTLH